MTINASEALNTVKANIETKIYHLNGPVPDTPFTQRDEQQIAASTGLKIRESQEDLQQPQQLVELCCTQDYTLAVGELQSCPSTGQNRDQRNNLGSFCTASFQND